MKEYKKEIYKNYISVHNEALYGTVDLAKIRSSYYLLDHFYSWALPLGNEAAILDIGCGEGGFVFYLQERGFMNASGIDVSKEQISKGRKLGIPKLFEGDLLEFLKKNKNTYDLITARDVLEHFTKEEVYDICSTVLDALRPGGKFLFQSPNGEGILAGKIFYGDFTHDILFSVDSSHQLLKSCGYDEIACKPVLFPISSLSSFVRFLGWKWVELNHKLKRKIVFGTSKGIFTPNLLVLATKQQ